MQLGDEVVAVGLGQGHEGAAHDDVLDLVDRVAQGLELVDAASGLLEGVVARADGAHGGRLVARVGLGAVLEVGVGPAGAVDADVARVGDVRASVRLAHDGDDGDARRRADGLGDQLGQDVLLVVLGHGGDDGRQRRHGADPVLLGAPRTQAVKVQVALRPLAGP